ncbi:MAG: response regulator [Treponema sp.]|jgi:AraC-like DNA-binding protein/DNA-binding NarL/FixJ family response regulator|nr:response regulator [Treponema sp.]
MLRVLLVDDEPLVLSGIKHLIDWEKNGCLVAGTASSGNEALNLLENLRPNLVICDIAMPDISGLEVLRKSAADFPETVFIMLTNYQDFELARESLRYRAVEYLLKNKLEEGDLEKALGEAAAEWENRSTLRRLNQGEGLGADPPSRIDRAVLELVSNSRSPFSEKNADLLYQSQMLSGFALASISLDYSQTAAMGVPAETASLFNWEKEIVRRLGISFFPKSLTLVPNQDGEEPDSRLLMFMWDLPRGGWEIRAGIFREQLERTSVQITRIHTAAQFSPWAEGRQDIEVWRKRLPPLTAAGAPPGKQQAAGHTEIIAKVKQYILDNMERHIMLREIANNAGISPGYLSTIFKKELNQNLMDYINMVKTERACVMLREEKYRIFEISYMLGFENAYYFTRVFHRYTGLSPSAYIKQERASEKEQVTDNEQP